MISPTTIEPITPADIYAINVPGIAISLGVGVTIWLVASFVIVGITKRVAAGTSLFRKPLFRWVAPAFRALEQERRVQRAHTIGALLNSVVGVLVSILTTVYVLKNLNVDVAP
ncbi:MAG TPA: mechanosensitive ion channel protein MscS, partial [Arthrobacter sp.]|nr:mechanosensitive ion channel protein MscS [Arthrobacter sp.]